MGDKLFSIIIPIYNVEDYIEETIDSIVNQTIGFEENIELILVNDGSSDNSENICLEYKKIFPDNIVYQYHENRGVSYTRNVGFSLSSGKYIIFLDSDDKWSYDAFEKVYGFFLQYGDDTGTVVLKMKYFEKRSSEQVSNDRFKKGTRIINILEEPNNFQTNVATAFFTRETIKDISFDERLVAYGEDVVFASQAVLKHGLYGVLDGPIYYRRIRLSENSLTNTASENPAKYSDYTINNYYYKLIELSKLYYREVIGCVQALLTNGLKVDIRCIIRRGR